MLSEQRKEELFNMACAECGFTLIYGKAYRSEILKLIQYVYDQGKSQGKMEGSELAVRAAAHITR